MLISDNEYTRISAAWLTLTRRCNNKCKWCYAQSSMNSNKEMPFSLAKDLIELTYNLNIKAAILIGGEPTLYPYFFDIVERLNRRNIKSFVVSNGRNFSDSNFAKKAVNSGITAFSISAKASNINQYKIMTGNNGFDQMVKGFSNLCKFGGKVSLSITIVKDSVKMIKELMQNKIFESADSISFELGSPIIIGKDIVADEIINPYELAESCILIHKMLENKNKIKYHFNFSIPLCLIPDTIKQELIAQNKLFTCCHIQSGTGVIFDESGFILPCNHFLDHSFGQYGKDFLSAEDFYSFWNSSRIQKFRTLCQCYPHKMCVKCEDWDNCGGGCLVKWLYWHPKDYIGKEVIIHGSY